MDVLTLLSPLVSWTFHLVMSLSVAPSFALSVPVLPFPSVNPSARSERFVSVLASTQLDWKMVVVMVPAASPLLVVGAPRSFLQLIQLLLGPFSNSRSLSHQPVVFAIAPDMLPCGISIRHSHCIQFLQSSTRFQSSDAYADVQINLGPGASQSLTSISLPLADEELLLRCHAVQRFRFLDPILCQNDTLVNHWSLANPDSMAPSLIQIVCGHGSVLVHHSFSESHLTRVNLSRNTQKCGSPVVLPPETSSSSTHRNESARPTACCHLTVFLAEDSEVWLTLGLHCQSCFGSDD